MISLKYTMASNNWNECSEDAIFKINGKRYRMIVWSDKSYNRAYGSICIKKIMYRHNGPGACLSIYDPRYVRFSRYDNYLFTKEDISNIIEIFRSDIDNMDIVVTQFNHGGKYSTISREWYKGDNTIWDFMMWCLHEDYCIPRFLPMPDYTKLKAAENDIMNYDNIRFKANRDHIFNNEIYKGK